MATRNGFYVDFICDECKQEVTIKSKSPQISVPVGWCKTITEVHPYPERTYNLHKTLCKECQTLTSPSSSTASQAQHFSESESTELSQDETSSSSEEADEDQKK